MGVLELESYTLKDGSGAVFQVSVFTDTTAQDAQIVLEDPKGSHFLLNLPLEQVKPHWVLRGLPLPLTLEKLRFDALRAVRFKPKN